MARFERSRDKGRKDFSRDRPPKREGRSRGSFDDRPSSRGGRFSDRDSQRSRPRREVEMTKVTCSSCGERCEVPFKPTSDKPIYCDACFSKKGKSGSDRISSKDLEMINEKLDKIIKALDIE